MKTFTRLIALSSICFSLACLSLESLASDSDIIAELKRCAGDSNTDTRIACYEALGSSLLNNSALASDDSPSQTETSSVATVQQASPEEQGPEEHGPEEQASEEQVPVKKASESQASDMPDSLGGGIYADKAGVKPETNRGHVTSCKKSSDRKWFYIFENGQVWKQVDSRKRRHKECDFWATIVKDSFGFKMIIDGQQGKIRIDRRR